MHIVLIMMSIQVFKLDCLIEYYSTLAYYSVLTLRNLQFLYRVYIRLTLYHHHIYRKLI